MTTPLPDGAEEANDRPAQRVQWASASAWRLHAALVAGLALSATATWLEWSRAHAGHTVAWVYTFEWPLFAVLGTYLWWRLLHADAPSSPTPKAHSEARSDPDPELLAWQAYLDRLHRADPPGGPPSRP